ncbi:hypothetical protein RCO28_37265 [Streptomyces sp. LHD-70]|uniref:hypothetical protein n=1 Tax=Streptomyces sp. LHD-70 TaxID=3072140 RepID=UPI00280C43A4|nr:hypothetical protein [Streptomyces sp. LHD-70]MDQ8708072.1 hypothetical protein [Streptomyces sp. LHD-70]
MLTHNDVTVPNARDCFRDAADLPVQFWGFKDVGLTTPGMEQLVADFREAGKTPVLEVVRFDEKDLLDAAKLAADCGVEYFTGGGFSPAVLERCRAAGMRYFPFCGQVGGSPIELTGTPDEVIEDARRIRELGADGVDLVAYRYTSGDPVRLAKRVVDGLGADQVILAGSVNSVERIQRMHEIGPLGYTMGGALFQGAFAPGGSFRDNLEHLVKIDADVSGANR